MWGRSCSSAGLVGPKRWEERGASKACRALARIVLAKGGSLADITVGEANEHHTLVRGDGGSYSWLRVLDDLPSDAPATQRLLGRGIGQLTAEQLVDRHGVGCALTDRFRMSSAVGLVFHDLGRQGVRGAC
ncbi:hypothetical protein ACFYXJ_06375 [Streptomyces sp. NPDC002667]|uniref:hypothetical protein n=1 Tax=Streptomyces sp. NPDC002667 TaxID=3364657 RepID=UPI0036ACEBA1